jgi:hypothetical protein
LGVVVDCLNHFITEDGFNLYAIVYKAIEKKDPEIYDYWCSNEHEMTMYKELIIEDYMYYSEAYINCAISIFPLIFLAPMFIGKLRMNISITFVEIAIIALIFILVFEAYKTYWQYIALNNSFCKQFGKSKS